jgi:biopolymer transport protein ExbD
MKKIAIGSKRSTGSTELNMAPLIDMVFILLIFFLVTTSFIKESGVDVKRPIQSDKPASTEKRNIILSITKEGQLFVEGRFIDIRSVRGYMERFNYENPGGSVVIAADTTSMMGIVIQALDECKLAGIKEVSVATNQP